MGQVKWRPFRLLLNKKDRKLFDQMVSYGISAVSVQLEKTYMRHLGLQKPSMDDIEMLNNVKESNLQVARMLISAFEIQDETFKSAQ